jgi:hypothetical protein
MVGRSHRRFWLCASLAALGLAAPGCSGNTPETSLQAVAGSVTLDGRPMPSGMIVFYPFAERKSLTTISASDLIKNGRFSIPRSKGLVPAKYWIAIFSGKRVAARPNPESSTEEPEAQAEDTIPARYNTETELEVEIKPRSIKELKIDIDSK